MKSVWLFRGLHNCISRSVSFLFIFVLLILAMAGCAVFSEPEPVPIVSSGGIIFVTATPAPQLRLSEGQRILPQDIPATPETPPTLPPDSYFAEANEMGKVLVLEYHRLGYPETRYQRTRQNFQADLQRLLAQNYYPTNFVDLINGLPDVPPGKKPVVLTFDDSDISQFRVMPDRTIDANSAVGVLLNFHTQHPQAWPMRGTFFVLGDDNADHIKIFGQPKWAKAKVKTLVDLGMEVASHTVNHVDLSTVSAERIEWELAVSKHVIEKLVPGYTVQTMSVPFGGFPYTVEFLRGGSWGDFDYAYVGNAAAWGGPSLSPFDSEFDAYRVPRLEVTATSFDYWFDYFEQNPHEYYISDGDPSRLTYPQSEIVAEN